MPALFIGPGNPMNALLKHHHVADWAVIGAKIPRPKAVLAISTHWYVPGTAVTTMSTPRTIHDLGGFPQELHQVQYPALGGPVLASRIQRLLRPIPAGSDKQWGARPWDLVRALSSLPSGRHPSG